MGFGWVGWVLSVSVLGELGVFWVCAQGVFWVVCVHFAHACMCVQGCDWTFLGAGGWEGVCGRD